MRTGIFSIRILIVLCMLFACGQNNSASDQHAEVKKNDAVNIIKDNSKIGKIFIPPVIDAIDLATGVEGESAI